MNKVIQIPTPLNMIKGGGDLKISTASFDDGTVMLEVDGVELWMEMESAVDLLESLSEAVADSFEKLREHMKGISTHG